jgi:uncharacterized protein (TIGR02246 family)
MNMNTIHILYHQLIKAWNNRNARDMADLFAEEGEMIGFDGSLAIGRSDIYGHLWPVFESHPTAPFITKVKSVQLLNSEAGILRAIAGMVPPGQTDLNPDVNTHQTLVAVKREDKWLIQLFQNTPAKFHGRPDLTEQMTKELRQLIK